MTEHDEDADLSADTRRPTAEREDVRAEYAALTSYSNLVVTFRFTVAGFFLAAVGLVAAEGIARDEAVLLIALTLSLWVIELRNRSLLGNLSGRGIQIERDAWGYTGAHAYDAFFSRQHKVRPAGDDEAPPPPPPDGTKIFFWKSRLAVTHTLGFDLMYLAVVLFAMYKVVA